MPDAVHPSHPPIETLLALLHRELPQAEAQAAQQHVATCSDCGSEMDALRLVDSAIAATLRPTASPAFVARLLARMRVQPAPGFWQRRATRWVAAVAAALLLMASGASIYRIATRPATPPAGLDQVYILLLYQDVNELKSLPPEPARSRSKEYVDWALRLRREGRYVSASRLHDTRGVIVAPGGEAQPGLPIQGDMGLTGYYIIRARDEADATAVAQAGPHPKYGTVVIRRMR